MSQDCTDEAGKIKNSNPFIEPVQSNAVVDMKGIKVNQFTFFIVNTDINFYFRCNGLE